jgi:hypothetical protein
MTSLKVFLTGTIALLCAQAFAAKPVEPPAAAAPILIVQGDSLKASGLTPGRTLFIMGLSRDVVAHEPRMGHAEVELPSKSDGTFELKLLSAAPVQSLWLLIDIPTGRYALTSPGGVLPAPMEFPRNALKSNGSGEIHHIEANLVYVDVVWIRPGVGAWRKTVGDGGRFDADGKPDGKTQLSVDDMKPVGESLDHPKKIEKGDTIFIFNPRTLAWFVTEVGA